MIKNILIYFIIFVIVINILFEPENKESFDLIKKETDNLIKKETDNLIKKETDNLIKKETIKPNSYNERNFEMDDKSVVMSMNTNLTKEECFNKINGKDINGATYDLKKNRCTLYFFAKKGKRNLNLESKI